MTTAFHRHIRDFLLLTFVVMAVGISACKSKKPIADAADAEAISARILFDSLESRQPVYTWYSAIGKMRAQTEEIAVGFTVRMRMLRDSAIWFRVEKFGFEVGRALITQDSAYILDRFNKEYYIEPIDDFLSEYNIPFEFNDLQRLLAGGTVSLAPSYLRSEEDEGRMRLTCNSGDIKAIYWFDPLYRLDQGVLVDLLGRNADLKYSDYRLVHGPQEIPFERYLSFFDGTASTELTMQLSEIEIDVPQSLKFSIPSNYERVD